MGMRTFFARVFGFHTATPRSQAVNPVQVAYQDAYRLLDAIYRGYPWSRRAWEHRMAQPRWEDATDLLRAAGILDRKGRFLFDPALDHAAAAERLLDAANTEQTKRGHRNYVRQR